MPAKYTLHVALTEPLVQYIRDRVASGRFVNASEAVRRAVELLIQQEAAATSTVLTAAVETPEHHHG